MKRYLLSLTMALSLVSVVMPGGASALSGSQFQAGHIIDDGIFFNQASMNTAAIQNFLNAKVPVCQTNHPPANGYNPPFICLKDYHQDTPARDPSPGLCNGFGAGNKSAAQIIFEVAQSCGVNPQVLIVMLQKEQGLVTDTWPYPIQYRSAMGYGCPDGAACDAEYYGFLNQVYAAAKQFKRYVRDANQYNYRAGFNNNIQWSPNAPCGASTVYIENRATAALYNYTPYQPNAAALNNLYGTGDGCSAYGNRNFWRYFNDWFGTTFGTVLLRGSGPTVFVRSGNPDVAYGVASGEVLRAYGLQNTAITPVSDSYLGTLNTSKMLTTLFRRPLDQTVFLADSGNAFGIPSGAQCTKWGRNCDNPNLIADMPYGVTNPLVIGPALGDLMSFDDTLFALEAGSKRPFLDRTEQSQSPWAGQGAIMIKMPLNSGQPGGQPILYGKRFVKNFTTNGIYYHSGGQKFTFSSYDNFKGWWDGSLVLSDKYSALNSSPPAATVLPDLAASSSELALMNGTSKLVIPLGSSAASAVNTDSTPQLSTLVAAKQSIVVDDSKAFQFSNGAIVTVRSGVFRPVPTMTDLNLLFTPANVLRAPVAFLNVYPVGKLLITSGRVVKPQDGGAMYLYGSDGYLWALGSISELNSTLTWTNNVINAPFSTFDKQGVKIFTALIKIGSAYYAVQPDGTARELPTQIMANPGGDDKSMPISGAMTARIPRDTRAVGFIRFDNGTISRVEGSEIRPIGSLHTYFALGGNGENTIQASTKASAAFNAGAPL